MEENIRKNVLILDNVDYNMKMVKLIQVGRINNMYYM